MTSLTPTEFEEVLQVAKRIDGLLADPTFRTTGSDHSNPVERLVRALLLVFDEVTRLTTELEQARADTKVALDEVSRLATRNTFLALRANLAQAEEEAAVIATTEALVNDPVAEDEGVRRHIKYVDAGRLTAVIDAVDALQVVRQRRAVRTKKDGG